MKPLRKIAFALALAACGEVAAGNFCAVTAGGANCSFPDLGSCQQALAGLGGQCVVNPQALPQPIAAPIAPVQRSSFYDVNAAIEKPDMARSMQEGLEAGARARRQREEHAARMKLLQAQTAAAQASRPRPELNGQPIGYWMMFKCPTPNGGSEYTGQPRVGCVVESVFPY